LVQQLGAHQAFETQSTVWMLMGVAVLFAGPLIDKWAAPALALLNTILLIGTRLSLAPEAEPRPSVLVLWWMLALTIWLYERILTQAFTRVWTELAERRHAEQEREALFQDLTHKNAELERFIYTASHDLRSPIITIRGFLGYIEEDVRNANLERLQGDISRIHAAANKMRELLDDLLDISRVGRLISPAEQISFREIVHEAQLLTTDRLNEKKIELRIDPNLPTVYGDRVRLVEVVQNLVDNAIKFMGNQMNPLIEIGARQQDGGWIFFVRDNGMGISPKYHERIFNLFDKLDPQSDGTGIGLAIVKRIIEFHNGRIWVEGEVGQGSTFYFSLPTKLS
jgi:signal transduction histidine kinase